MSGYAASARIVGASPRLAAFEPAPLAPHGSPATDLGPVIEERIVNDGGPGDGAWAGVVERWGRVHDRWSQLVFFLTDPDSWR